MTELKNPAARGSAGRAQDTFRLATNASENIHSPLKIQLAFLARRLGGMDPATLAALASLAFGEARR